MVDEDLGDDGWMRTSGDGDFVFGTFRRAKGLVTWLVWTLKMAS